MDGHDPKCANLRALPSLSLRSIASPRYSHIRPILESGQDATGGIPDGAVDDAGWVRGGDYYADMGR